LSDSTKRKICVVLVDRANYGRLKPIMEAIRDNPRFEIQVLAAGTMVLERFDQPVRVVRNDGFQIDAEVYLELEGSTPGTMAKSVGFGIVEFAGEFQRLKPDFVVIIGDRYEALSAAIAAAYMNLPIVHLQGGEVSGSIDESARHAISKFAHFHVPATEQAKQYLIRMGEKPETILCVGCPSSDLAKTLDRTLDPAVLFNRGHGAVIDVKKPFLLVVFHPTTTEFGGERSQMDAVLAALNELKMQTVLLWPNIDAGSDHISKAIRDFRNQNDSSWLRTLTNLTPEYYLKVLANTACAVGNSSSFVRDAGFFGTPVALVGGRQRFRECDQNVTHVVPQKEAIAAVIRKQLAVGRYPAGTLYGDGTVAQRFVAKLETIVPYVQKHLAYASESE
jgi:UDP-hydrolysing UDP-N-acetyl-D-glucosamine 2-epimerase